jgi:hypothetical protein
MGEFSFTGISQKVEYGAVCNRFQFQMARILRRSI